MTLRWIWADEAGQMKLQAWINIQGRVSILKGRVFLSTTPYTMNWLRNDFFENWKKGNKDYDVIQFRSVDNPYFPLEEFERVKETMDRRTFERRYCGLFTKMEGLVYEDFNYSTHTVDVLPQNFDAIIAGIDWGFTAPAAIAIIGLKDNVAYVIDEFYKEGQTTDQLILVAKDFKKKYPQLEKFYCDSAEPDRIESFRQANLNAVSSDKAITFGISKIQGMIKQGFFFVSKTCLSTLEEIEVYHYPEIKENRNADERPEKIDDHLMDAIRYAIVSYLGIHKLIFFKSENMPFSIHRPINEEAKPIMVKEYKPTIEEIRAADRKIIEEEERKRFLGLL